MRFHHVASAVVAVALAAASSAAVAAPKEKSRMSQAQSRMMMADPETTGSVGTRAPVRVVRPQMVQQQQVMVPMQESCTNILCPGFVMRGVGY